MRAISGDFPAMVIYALTFSWGPPRRHDATVSKVCFLQHQNTSAVAKHNLASKFNKFRSHEVVCNPWGLDL